MGKKGSKEDLIVKLIDFNQQLAKKLEDNPEARAKAERAAEKAAKKDDSDDSAEELDEESEDESDSDVDADPLNISPEDAEKQLARESHVRKELRHVLLKSGPFALEELPKAMESVVKGFT